MVTNSSSNIKTAASGKVLQGQGVGVANDFSTATYPSASGGTGKILYDNGTNFIESTPTFPASASATSRKMIVSDGTNWVASTETWAVPGTSGNVLTSDGTNWTSAAASGGTFLKQVRNSNSAGTALTNDVNNGATSFLNTQGTQILTVSITPSNVNNILVIQGVAIFGVQNSAGTAPQSAILGLFQNAISPAIYSTATIIDTVSTSLFNNNFTTSLPFLYYMTAGTTSSITFNIRAGGSGGNSSVFLNAGTGTISLTNPLTAFTVSEYTA
jgi:hypothetical protein